MFAVLLVGCISDRNQKSRYENSEWIIANDLNGVPTKIQYCITIEYADGVPYWYGISLQNGYDKPLEIYFKVYFSTSSPENYSQYLYTNKGKEWAVRGRIEIQKVEIIKLENK